MLQSVFTHDDVSEDVWSESLRSWLCLTTFCCTVCSMRETELKAKV